MLVAGLVALSLTGAGRPALAEGDVEQRIAEFWQRIDSKAPTDLLAAADLGQWGLNVIERDASARITVFDFRASTGAMQAAMERVREVTAGTPSVPAVETRIAEFWKRLDAMQSGDHLASADLGQWALNVTARDPNARIMVTDFRASTASMQQAIERAGRLPSVAPAPSPAPTTPPTAAGPIVWAPRAPVACAESDGELRVQSGDRVVRGKIFRPSSGGPHPAMLVLHTRGGPSAHVDGQAAYFASQGYVAFAPDYFTPGGVTRQSFSLLTFWPTYTDAIREHLARAIDCVRALPNVAPDRIGVMGFSLGAGFAVILATREGTAAAVSWYGSLHGAPASITPTRYTFAEVASQVRAPVLILHGDADTEINPNVARRAHDELGRQGKRSEIVMYPGVGHGFDQQGAAPTYIYDARATEDARSRTLGLLREALR